MKNSTLKEIGLNDSEIKVYFSLLKLESSTVGPIIDNAKVPDSKIYVILDKLKEKGLASFVIKNKVKHFQSSDPKNLSRLLDEKRKEIEEQKKDLEENIIPEIERRRKLTEEKQEAIVYEGIKGLKSAFTYLLDCLEKGEEYQVLMFGEYLGTKSMVNFFRDHHKKRVAKKVGIRFVANKKDKKIIEEKHSFIKDSTRYTTHKFPVGIYIFKNQVMTVPWGENQAAFIIKSKQNYESYREFFEELWKKAI